jgi:hypothetical protein
MSSTFSPLQELELFCRFCSKITPNTLDRSIAANGRNLDRNSTFEYYCTKCFKTACFSGNDLAEQISSEIVPEPVSDDAIIDEAMEQTAEKSSEEVTEIIAEKTGVHSAVHAIVQEVIPAAPRIYAPKDHFYIGETIEHKSFKEKGVVVGKDLCSTPKKILVLFEKSGLKKLVEDL